MYAQLEVSKNYPFNKNEIININNIKKILNYGKIDNTILFNYGLYYSQVAGSILKVNIVDIIKRYNNLPIYDKQDIAISSEDIMAILNIKPSKVLKSIYKDLVKQILNGNIENDYNSIKEYLINRKGNG